MKTFQIVQRSKTDWDIYDSKERVFKIRDFKRFSTLLGDTKDTENIRLEFEYVEEAVMEAFERMNNRS